jgi:hypothetical protein
MRLSVLERGRQPPGPLGGEVFEGLTVDSAIERLRTWKITVKTIFKLEESSDRWMTFDSNGADEFEAAFQSSPESWQKVIGIQFNAEGCCVLAASFFKGDESALRRYPLDTRPAKRISEGELRAIQAIREQLLTRKWWQFWK